MSRLRRKSGAVLRPPIGREFLAATVLVGISVAGAIGFSSSTMAMAPRFGWSHHHPVVQVHGSHEDCRYSPYRGWHQHRYGNTYPCTGPNTGPNSGPNSGPNGSTPNSRGFTPDSRGSGGADFRGSGGSGGGNGQRPSTSPSFGGSDSNATKTSQRPVGRGRRPKVSQQSHSHSHSHSGGHRHR